MIFCELVGNNKLKVSNTEVVKDIYIFMNNNFIIFKTSKISPFCRYHITILNLLESNWLLCYNH